jgi:hypothetical protein
MKAHGTCSKWPQRLKEPNILQYSLKELQELFCGGNHLEQTHSFRFTRAIHWAHSQLSILLHNLQDFSDHPTQPRLARKYCSQIVYSFGLSEKKVESYCVERVAEETWRNCNDKILLVEHPLLQACLPIIQATTPPNRAAFHCRGVLTSTLGPLLTRVSNEWMIYMILKRNVNLTSTHAW